MSHIKLSAADYKELTHRLTQQEAVIDQRLLEMAGTDAYRNADYELLERALDDLRYVLSVLSRCK